MDSAGQDEYIMDSVNKMGSRYSEVATVTKGFCEPVIKNQTICTGCLLLS